MRSLVWGIWVAAAAALTFPAFIWHLTQFTKPGPAFLPLILGSLAALLGPAALHYRLRDTLIGRRSLLLIVIPALAICFWYEPLASALNAVLGLAAWGLGRAVLTRFCLDDDESGAALALPLLAGLGLLTETFLVLGAFGLFNRTAIGAVILLALLIGSRQFSALPYVCRRLQNRWTEDTGLRSPLISAGVIMIAALAGLAAVVAITPAIAADALTFHLNLTRSYIDSGQLRTPQTIPYGWYPQGFETLMVPLWAFGGQPAAQLIGPAFFALALLMIAAIVRICGYSRAAALAAISILIATPFIHWTGSVVKNDLMLASWQFAALYSVLRWHAARDFRWILLSCFFIGLCLQVKLTLLFALIPIGTLWLLALWRERRWQTVPAMVAVLLLFGSFSLARTYEGTGTPFFPAAASASVARPALRNISWTERLFRLPWSLHFHGRSHFESSSDNPIGVATIILLPALLPLPRRRFSWQERACWWFVAAYIAYWLTLLSVLRYVVPAVAILLALLAARACSAVEQERSSMRASVTAAFAYAFAFGWVVTVMIQSYPAHLPFLLGHLDGRGFLRATLEPFGSMEYVARNAAPNDWVLDLGAYAPVYSHDPARTILNNRKPGDFTTTHLLEGLQQQPDVRWVVLPNSGTGPDLSRLLSELRSARHVYGDAWFSVYRVENR